MLKCSIITALIAFLVFYIPTLYLEEYSLNDPVYKGLANAQGQFLKVGGVAVHYILEGPEDGELVLVLHGISGSAYMMRSITKPMADAGYKVLTFDFYGRGHSGTPVEDVAHTDILLVNQTVSLIEEVGKRNIIPKHQLEKFHIVALSLGGSVAVVYSSLYPQKVKSLTLLAPAGLTFEVPITTHIGIIPGLAHLLRNTLLGRYLMDARVPRAFVNPEVSKDIIREFQMLNHYHLSRDDFIKAFLSTLNHYPLANTTEAYRKVGLENFPVLIIWGDKDMTVPHSCAKQAKELIPRAELIILTETGHMALIEKNKETVDPILQFLKTGTTQN